MTAKNTKSAMRAVAVDRPRPVAWQAMGEASFFTDAAKKRVSEAVAAAESHTAAEFVVVVRRASAPWREVDLGAGAVVAMAVLLVLVFHPQPIPDEAIPLDVAVSFLAAAVIAASLGPVKRALLPRKRASEQVRMAARSAFVDQGVSRTRGRTGVLVFVSMLERRVEVVADVGVDAKLLETQARSLEASVQRRPDLDAFVAGVRSLGPARSGALPHAADDVNELPDAPVMA